MYIALYKSNNIPKKKKKRDRSMDAFAAGLFPIRHVAEMEL